MPKKCEGGKHFWTHFLEWLLDCSNFGHEANFCKAHAPCSALCAMFLWWPRGKVTLLKWRKEPWSCSPTGCTAAVCVPVWRGHWYLHAFITPEGQESSWGVSVWELSRNTSLNLWRVATLGSGRMLTTVSVAGRMAMVWQLCLLRWCWPGLHCFVQQRATLEVAGWKHTVGSCWCLLILTNRNFTGISRLCYGICSLANDF